jgi:zinc and cadmium transporter
MEHTIVGYALCLSAGVFLCISLGDLLPELHFHSHDQIPLSLMLLLGLALAWGIRYFEPPHAHPHDHHGHDHPHAVATSCQLVAFSPRGNRSASLQRMGG